MRLKYKIKYVPSEYLHPIMGASFIIYRKPALGVTWMYWDRVVCGRAGTSKHLTKKEGLLEAKARCIKDMKR